MKIKTLLLSALIAVSLNVFSQTLYVPSGTSGIGTSSTTNVGIGISNPSYKLHVVTPANSWKARFSGSDGYIDIGPANSNWAHIYTDRPNFIFNKSVYSMGGFSSYSTNDLYLQTNGVNRLRIANADGKIYIYSNFFVSSDKWITIGASSASGPRLAMAHSAQFGHAFIDYKENLYFRADDPNVSAMVLQGDGSVAIGVQTAYTAGFRYSPGYKLSVNGKILCEGIEVVANVPSADYVFEENYSLKPLTEVESFIKQNKHLPEIPSADEFKNGYNLGKMDNLLLQKIEELTLYVIEQGKEINALKQENQELKKATGLTK